MSTSQAPNTNPNTKELRNSHYPKSKTGADKVSFRSVINYTSTLKSLELSRTFSVCLFFHYFDVLIIAQCLTLGPRLIKDAINKGCK